MFQPLNKQTTYYIVASCVALIALSQIILSELFIDNKENEILSINFTNLTKETNLKELEITKLVPSKFKFKNFNSSNKNNQKNSTAEAIFKKVIKKKEQKSNDLVPTEVRFNSKHEILGITVSSIIVVHGLSVEDINESMIKSEIHMDIPKLAINFTVLNNFTFNNLKINSSASSSPLV